MALIKKQSENRIGAGRPGPGRPPGSPNRITAEVRERFADLLADNQPRLQGWLDEVAAKDPRAAFELWLRMAEFVIPKLHRVQQIDPAAQFALPNIDLGEDRVASVRWAAPTDP